MAKKIAKSASKSAGKSAGKPASKPASKSSAGTVGKAVVKKPAAKAGKPVAARAGTPPATKRQATAGKPGKPVKPIAGAAASKGRSGVGGNKSKSAAVKAPPKVVGKPAAATGKAKSGLAAAVSQAVTAAPAGRGVSAAVAQMEGAAQLQGKAPGRPGSKWERPSLKRTPAQQAAMTASKGRLEKQREVARAFAVDVARLLADLRCENVVILDWSRYSSTSDYVVVATGTSDRQMRTCGDEVSKLAETISHGLPRVESDERATWVLCDASDVVAHVFEPNTRAHYDMEGMYPDAPRVDWQR